MDKLGLDELIKTLITKFRSRESPGNAVAVASKLLEITNATTDIERELDECKAAIKKNLRSLESLMMALGRLRAGGEKLAAFDGELRAFEADSRSRISDIERTRDVFSRELRDEDENRENEAIRELRLREIVRDMTQMRDEARAKINTADQSIAILTAQLEDTNARISCAKMENDAFRARLEATQNDLIRRRRESLAKRNQLLASKD